MVFLAVFQKHKERKIRVGLLFKAFADRVRSKNEMCIIQGERHGGWILNGGVSLSWNVPFCPRLSSCVRFRARNGDKSGQIGTKRDIFFRIRGFLPCHIGTLDFALCRDWSSDWFFFWRSYCENSGKKLVEYFGQTFRFSGRFLVRFSVRFRVFWVKGIQWDSTVAGY